MAVIVLCSNPLDLGDNTTHYYDGQIIDWLQDIAPTGFGNPIEVHLNGYKMELNDLDTVISGDDVATVFVLPAGPAIPFIVNALISIAISFVLGKLFAPKIRPPSFVDQPEENTVYSVKASQNAARLGGVIPVIYGDVITTPDYISQPYSTFTEKFAPDAVSHTVDLWAIWYASWPIEHPYTFNGPVKVYAWNTLLHPPPPSAFIRTVSPGDTGTVIKPAGTNLVVIPEPGVWGNEPVMAITDIRIESRDPSTYLTVDDTDWAVTRGDHYLFYLLCIGHGRVRNKNTMVGDTDINNIPGYIKGKAYQPAQHQSKMGAITADFNDDPLLPELHENVITAIDFGGQVLHKRFDTSGRFPISDNQEVIRVAVDIGFDAGLYLMDDLGNIRDSYVDIKINTFIHGTNTSLGVVTVKFQHSLSDISALRRTIVFNVPKAQVDIEIERSHSTAGKVGRISNAVYVHGVKGYVEDTPTTQPVYGHNTLLAVRILASEFTSNASASRIRVKAKRLAVSSGILPVDIESNSSADAFADVYRNTHYGAGRPAGEIDMALLTRLKTYWGGGSTGAGFNGVFNQKTTVYEALKAVIAPVAAQPLFVGGLVTVNYDGVKDIRKQVFSNENIIEGSFKVSYNFDRVGEPDGINVQYNNPKTWQREFYVYPKTAGAPRNEILFGCTNIFHAALFGAYLWDKARKMRKIIAFNTELEGLIPRPGDRIGVCHDVPMWGEAGLIIRYDAPSKEMVLDREHTLSTGATIVIRGSDGVPESAIGISAGASPSRVILATPPAGAIADYDSGDGKSYVINNTGTIQDFIVLTTQPSGETVAIKAVEYDATAFDNAMPFLRADL